MKKIALLGSTGSIGRQVLNVVRRNREDYEIVSLSADKDAETIGVQAQEFHPKRVCVNNPNGEIRVPAGTEVLTGENAYLKAITDDADLVVVATVGYSGLSAVLKAFSKKKDVALANKESLVVGGELVMQAKAASGANLFPVDSEHSAIWQALGFRLDTPFSRLILTASGGAFRDLTAKELKRVKAKDALLHPTWQMGKKITVDCATLVNKAFEVAEAKWLYGASLDQIKAVIHRESIIHSLVEFQDGACIAELSYPTMEIPIALALNHEKRVPSNVAPLDFEKLKSLTFEKIDDKRFPCFSRVVSAVRAGGLYPAVASGANEVAVEAFLKDEIAYTDIYAVIDDALSAYTEKGSVSEAGVKDADAFSRARARAFIKTRN